MGYEFKFADLGEGITEGELVRWLVKEGDTVKEDQSLAEVETDKAIVEIPSPVSGAIEKLHVPEGETIQVGAVLVSFAEGGSVIPAAPKTEKLQPAKQHPAKAPTSAMAKAVASRSVTQKQVRKRVAGPALATPHIRRLAREQGIELEKLIGTGPEGRITEADLARGPHALPVPVDEGITAEQFEKWGPIKRVLLKGARRKIALHMAQAMRLTAPVTHIDEVDVTGLLALRETKKREFEKQGVKLTILPLVMRAVVAGLKKFPSLNASLVGDEVIYKKFYNVGFAVDVEETLMVPVIKDVEKKSLVDIARELQDLSIKARERSIDLADLKGSSFSITNLGSIGGRYFTPIINYPDGAILGLGHVHKRPWVEENKVTSRPVMSLNLTFDHRVTDGATGARFTNFLIEQLENPESLL